MDSFRFGNVLSLYYQAREKKQPSQLDLLDVWLPGLIVREVESNGNTKREAEYQDREFVIDAVRYHGSFYAGSSKRVSQITGRLIGTAKGNQEKERRTASLIQKHLAGQLVTDFEAVTRLQETVKDQLSLLQGKAHEAFYVSVYTFIETCIIERKGMDEYDRLSELFPMDDEVFEGVLYNAVYQLEQVTEDSIANGYLWLLLGTLLRNETGRLVRLYDSSFIPIRRQMSETNEVLDKLFYLLKPQAYQSFYEGDDLDQRFPGIEWYCDHCRAHLNEQEGFDDHVHSWKCRVCGYLNQIEFEEIYDNEEDWQNGIHRHGKEDFERALKQRLAEKGSKGNGSK